MWLHGFSRRARLPRLRNAIGAFALLCSCSPESVERSPAAEAPLVIAVSNDISSLNPLLGVESRFNHDVLDLMFLHLVEEQPDYADHPPTFAAQLARSFEWSADRRALTFHLQEHATWSDGQPITAEDVRWTWQAQTHPDIAWDYAQSKDHILDVAVVDPKTVRFRFDQAYSMQLAEANEGPILPSHVWNGLPFSEWRNQADWFRQHLVVSGPYTLASWTPMQSIELQRNPGYFDPESPATDSVRFQVIPDKAQQIQELTSGAVHFVEHVPPAQARELERSDTVELLPHWARMYGFICWNTERELFRRPEVRRALTMAIDRTTLIEALWANYARVSVSPIISSVWATHPDLTPHAYDPQAAREILAQHGWRDSDRDGMLDRNGRAFSFELSTNAGNQTRIDAAILIQEQLRRIGVQANPQVLEFNTLIQKNQAHDFDATIGAWYIDTSLDLTYAFHSNSIQEGYNYGGYSNSQVDQLIDRARSAVRLEDAAGQLRALQEILHSDQPYTFLWEPQRINAFRRGLRGVTPNPLSSFRDLPLWHLAD